MADCVDRFSSGSDEVEGFPHETGALRVGLQQPSVATLPIADRRTTDPPALESPRPARCFRSLGPHVVVKLRERSEHILQEVPGRIPADRLGDRTYLDTELQELAAEIEMLLQVPCKAVELPHENKIDINGGTVTDHPLQLGAIRSLG